MNATIELEIKRQTLEAITWTFVAISLTTNTVTPEKWLYQKIRKPNNFNS